MTRPPVAAGLLAAILAAILATGLAACVAADEPVLTAGPTLRTCADVLARTSDLQACEFDGVCSWSDPASPNGVACCTYFAVCAGGRLLIEPMCPPGCQACMDDTQCEVGLSWCSPATGTCEACPDPSMCAACPPGTEPIVRNGCATCTCAPASECSGGDPNGMELVCAPMETCYRGQLCTDGCAPGDASCCANVCAAPGCADPAPQGCLMDCPMAANCSQCMASGCTCENGVWRCTPVCSDVVGPCFLPAT